MNPRNILIAAVLMLAVVSELAQQGGAIDRFSGDEAPPPPSSATPTSIAAAAPPKNSLTGSSGPAIFIPDYDPGKMDGPRPPSATETSPQAVTFAWANSSLGELSKAQLGLEGPSPTGIMPFRDVSPQDRD